jgi:hypothetical protein
VTTFPVATFPEGIVFDGRNIWVGTQYCPCVTKLRANDGANLRVFPVGLIPDCIVFDDVNIWATEGGLGFTTVAKLRASDGALVGTFNAGSGPSWMTFDGVNIWVSNNYDTTVSKL